jgi:hypothetical protein
MLIEYASVAFRVLQNGGFVPGGDADKPKASQSISGVELQTSTDSGTTTPHATHAT